MWLLMIFWKTFRGMWRLVIGLIIGVVLYVITFTTPNLVWIFNGVHEFAQNGHAWLSAQHWFSAYQKWDYLVKPADRLPLIIYVLVGRFIWLLFEAVFITFPHWLLFNSKKQKKTVESTDSVPDVEKAAVLDSNASASSSETPASSAQGKPVASGVNLERHIDKTSETEKAPGEQKSTD